MGGTSDVAIADANTAVRFLHTCFHHDDWVAVFLKNYSDGRVAQHVGPVSWVASPGVLSWLVEMNRQGFNVYVSLSNVAPGRRSRTRDAVICVRHLFVDADGDAHAVLATVERRGDLPEPSYVIHTSPARLHVLWRVEGFDAALTERLQKQLARELHTDPAAPAVTQVTRIPGFLNHKTNPPALVTIEYRDVTRCYSPSDFPAVPEPTSPPARYERGRPSDIGAVERARRYLAAVPAAIAGQHGDFHTFRVCCRLMRGFALDEAQALDLLTDWNQRCQPPWSTADLLAKLRSAARNGREPLGGLL